MNSAIFCIVIFIVSCLIIGWDNYQWSKEPLVNFPFTWRGKSYWYSRSMATANFVFTNIDGIWHVLVNKRGIGTPNEQGKYCCPCGYLDHDETLEECACRETFEECGLKLDPSQLQIVNINSDPKENNQNVTVRYLTVLDKINVEELNSNNSEKNEVDEIKLIPVVELDKYEWAFNHDAIIKSMLLKLN